MELDVTVKVTTTTTMTLTTIETTAILQRSKMSKVVLTREVLLEEREEWARRWKL
jgi:collagenase-like PrtC family protease